MRNELHSTDSRRLVPYRRLYLRALGNRSSSNKTPLRVRLLAPGNWCGEWEESRERDQGNSANDPKWSRSRKLERRDESTVEKEPEIQNRPQNWRNCTRCDLEKWRANGENPRSSGRLKKWLTHDIYSWRSENTQKTLMIFREESSRIIHEMGNIELYE